MTQMSKPSKPTKTNEVNNYLERLVHPMKEVVLEIRTIILSKFPEISEQIKWNSLSFYYNGEMTPFNAKEYKRDLIVLNLNKKDYVLLIFPTGSSINDTKQLLEGDYTDGRRMLKIKSTVDAKIKMEELYELIQSWISQVT